MSGGGLGLLQAGDVGLELGQELEHARQPRRSELTFQVTMRTPTSSAIISGDAAEKLQPYRAKRDFAATAEPSGADATDGARTVARFVVQEHHATRLHWDLRLEHEGVLASWAIPNGIPPDPAENRLAVHTEDHPLEYLDFEGEIPAGEYGAGTMRIWDRGTFETHLWDDKKVEVTFHGERLSGRYGLFPIGRGPDQAKDWMIHRMDPPADPDREPMPERILPMLAGRRRLAAAESGVVVRGQVGRSARDRLRQAGAAAAREPQPARDHRRLPRGARAARATSGCARRCSTGRSSPSTTTAGRASSGCSGGCTSPRRARCAGWSASTPVVYAIFDLLYLDGHNLMGLPYERAARAARGARAGRPGVARPGALTRATAGGCSRRPRRRGSRGSSPSGSTRATSPVGAPGAWVKIKHTRRQELVIGGWLPGEGRRTDRIGALLMGYYEGDGAASLRRARGHRASPTGRSTSWPGGWRRCDATSSVRPRAQAAAQRRVRRARAGGRGRVQRVDRRRASCARPRSRGCATTSRRSRSSARTRGPASGRRGSPTPRRSAPGPPPRRRCSTRSSALPDGALAVIADGRRLKISNWDKVLFPRPGSPRAI